MTELEDRQGGDPVGTKWLLECGPPDFVGTSKDEVVIPDVDKTN